MKAFIGMVVAVALVIGFGMVTVAKAACPRGEVWDQVDQLCVKAAPAKAPARKSVVRPAACPSGQHYDSIEQTCIANKPTTPPKKMQRKAIRTPCPPGQTYDSVEQTCITK